MSSKVLVGDETGLLKVHSMKDGSCLTYGAQSRSKAIKSFCRYKNSLLVLRADQSLELWDCKIDLLRNDEDDEDLINHLGTMITDIVNPKGVVEMPNIGSLCYGNDGDILITKLISNNSGSLKNNNKVIDDDQGDDNLLLDMHLFDRFNIDGPLNTSSTVVGGLVAFGGYENDIKLYNIEYKSIEWQALNLPYDHLSLRVPIWITAISFIDNKNTTMKNNINLMTGTGYKQVRVYDLKASQRPIMSFDIDDFCITTLIPFQENEIIVGDGGGGLYMYDLRNKRKIGTFQGAAGSIRDVLYNKIDNSITSISLDRYLRVHDCTSHILKVNKFLNTRPTCMKWFS